MRGETYQAAIVFADGWRDPACGRVEEAYQVQSSKRQTASAAARHLNDCFCVSRIILLPFDKGLNARGGASEHRGQVYRSRASNNALWHGPPSGPCIRAVFKKGETLATRPSRCQDHIVMASGGMKLKPSLCEIQADDANFRGCSLLSMTFWRTLFLQIAIPE